MLSRGLITYKIAAHAADWRKGIRARKFAITPCRKPASNFAGKTSFNLALDPFTARAYHDETLPQESGKSRPFLLHVWAEILLDEKSAEKCVITPPRKLLKWEWRICRRTSVPEAEKSTCVRRKRDVSA
ncbi:hypothetical protein ACP0HM_25280 [Escherichia coli]